MAAAILVMKFVLLVWMVSLSVNFLAKPGNFSKLCVVMRPREVLFWRLSSLILGFVSPILSSRMLAHGAIRLELQNPNLQPELQNPNLQPKLCSQSRGSRGSACSAEEPEIPAQKGGSLQRPRRACFEGWCLVRKSCVALIISPVSFVCSGACAPVKATSVCT